MTDMYKKLTGWICLAALGLAPGLAGCKDDKPPPQPVASAATTQAPIPAFDAPEGVTLRSTTSPELAIKHLDKRIEKHKAQLDTLKSDALGIQRGLVSDLVLRSSRIGTVSDLDVALEVSEAYLKRFPKSQKAMLTRAQALAAVHRFSEALEHVEKAEAMGATPYHVDSTKGSILLGLGRYEEGYQLVKAQRERASNHATLAMEAHALGKLGRYDEANQVFEKAITEYKDISPFHIAWIHFERGSMWDAAGKHEAAERDYRTAVAYLPRYAHAVGHLVSYLSAAEAEKMLRLVIERADDPEYPATLSVVLEEQKKGSGAEMLAKATAGYEELMKKQPLAFADHAGWFYLRVAKDYDKAVAVAQQNFDNRQVAEAYELLILSLDAAGKKDEACQRKAEAEKLSHATDGLKKALGKVSC